MKIMQLLKQQKGQGLLESLIAMLLIFAVVVALLSFETTLAYHDSLISQQNDATQLAVTTLENLRDYQVLSPQNPYTAYSAIASGTSTSVGLNTTFTITWTVTAFVNPTYKTLSVAVTWTDRRGVAQTIRMASNIAGVDPTTSSSVM
jgi:Tfp pilus assembly protein PilV